MGVPGCDKDCIGCEADVRGDGDRGSERGERREVDLSKKYGSGEDGSDAEPRSPYSERGVEIYSEGEGPNAGEGDVGDVNEREVLL